MNLDRFHPQTFIYIKIYWVECVLKALAKSHYEPKWATQPEVNPGSVAKCGLEKKYVIKMTSHRLEFMCTIYKDAILYIPEVIVTEITQI